MPFTAPVAATISAIAAVGGLGYTAYAGERASKVRRKGLREQRTAQGQAQSTALKESQRASEADRKARELTPDLMSILGANTGPGNPSTVLTSPLGVGGAKSLGL